MSESPEVPTATIADTVVIDRDRLQSLEDDRRELRVTHQVMKCLVKRLLADRPGESVVIPDAELDEANNLNLNARRDAAGKRVVITVD